MSKQCKNCHFMATGEISNETENKARQQRCLDFAIERSDIHTKIWGEGVGRCHRYPPTFPVVFFSDWCGEWEK